MSLLVDVEFLTNNQRENFIAKTNNKNNAENLMGFNVLMPNSSKATTTAKNIVSIFMFQMKKSMSLILSIVDSFLS